MSILTFDVGTTSMKAAVYSETFDIMDTYAKEYALRTYDGNRIELNPAVYWDTFKESAQYFAGKGYVGGVTALAITTQGETLIAVDKNGVPLDNAVVWLDSRAEKEAAYLAERFPTAVFYGKTGMSDITAAMPVSKLLWYRNNKPEIFAKTHKFLLLEDYLLFKLTGRYVSNHSLLSSTGYFDINTNGYWQDILSAADVDPRKLPEVLPSCEPVGTPSPYAQKETGLGSRTLIATCAMDQVASAVGAGNINPGAVTVTLGTALAAAVTIDGFEPGKADGIMVFRHFDNKYIKMPYCPTAAIIIKWFKDEFLTAEACEAERKGISPYTLADGLAGAAPAGAGGVIMLPHFTGKLCPEYNLGAKGVFYGVGLDTGKGCFIRAIQEGVAFMLRENLEYLFGDGARTGSARLLGGGAKSRLWPQIIADICGVAVETMADPETSRLGAAVMAALASGIYKSAAEARGNFIRVKERYLPNQSNREIYDEQYERYLSLYNMLAHFS